GVIGLLERGADLLGIRRAGALDRLREDVNGVVAGGGIFTRLLAVGRLVGRNKALVALAWLRRRVHHAGQQAVRGVAGEFHEGRRRPRADAEDARAQAELLRLLGDDGPGLAFGGDDDYVGPRRA